jgi:hypothetical protein
LLPDQPQPPDRKPRRKISGKERNALKEFLDQRARRLNNRPGPKQNSENPDSNPQFSSITRQGSASDKILHLLTVYKGDRKKVFKHVKDDPEIRGQKDDKQLKWMIAQTAWRFGFRRR